MNLHRWKNTWQNRDFRNYTNLNWEHLEGTYNKIEEKSELATINSTIAKERADVASETSQSTQNQLDTIVVKGDSSVEAAQARTDTDNKVHVTLKARADSDFKKNANQIEILNNIQVSLDMFPRIIPEADDAPRIQRAIDSISTPEYTEAIPSEGVKKHIIIPAGRYKVSSKTTVPAYVNIIGAGRHATIFDSYITNGDPVFQVKNDQGKQQFYNTLSGFTINGRNQECQGIQIYKTSRWVLRDVIINATLFEGLTIYESYLGDLYSVLVRACGDSSHASVLLTGPDANNGSHNVSFYGGEINGGGLVKNGVHLRYGATISFFGTSIEGFADGIGFVNANGSALNLHAIHFEGNKEDYVEVGPTFSTNIKGCYFAPNTTGTGSFGNSRGHIGIYYAQGASIEGNYFQGSTAHIFDSTNANTGRLYMSSVKTNLTPTFPMKIDQSILDSAATTGTVIEMFDGNYSNYVYGQHKFRNAVLCDDEIRTVKGIHRIGHPDEPGSLGSPSLTSGSGHPEGLRTAPPGSIYTKKTSSFNTGNMFFVKESGTGNTGWKALQGIHAGPSSNRPADVSTGYIYFDTTLHKPIFRDNTISAWVDGIGNIV